MEREWGVIIWNGIGMPPKDKIQFTNDKILLIQHLENNCKAGDKIWLNYGKTNGDSWKPSGMTNWATDYQIILKDLKKTKKN